ncbi:MAG: TraR/DksA C4-type zinc finger protein, partial [Microthrixaceae bacterium]|nr:TraR/DksA C4-type zinc finger protein [Microthrixaceae bacterium]
KGTYGICESSGLPIPKERLRAIPWARQRVEFKTSRFN